MSGDKWLMMAVLGFSVVLVVFIISHANGFKAGYESCMRDAVENNCATITVSNNQIKYQWKIPASATAELK